MANVWDMVVALCALAGAFGGMFMVWHKFSRENAGIRKDIQKHDEKMREQDKQIAIILVEKASCSDMVKLGELVDNIQSRMIAHHTDVTIHRNKDFELRMEALSLNLTKLAEENREDHKTITALIKEKI